MKVARNARRNMNKLQPLHIPCMSQGHENCAGNVGELWCWVYVWLDKIVAAHILANHKTQSHGIARSIDTAVQTVQFLPWQFLIGSQVIYCKSFAFHDINNAVISKKMPCKSTNRWHLIDRYNEGRTLLLLNGWTQSYCVAKQMKPLFISLEFTKSNLKFCEIFTLATIKEFKRLIKKMAPLWMKTSFLQPTFDRTLNQRQDQPSWCASQSVTFLAKF